MENFVYYFDAALNRIISINTASIVMASWEMDDAGIKSATVHVPDLEGYDINSGHPRSYITFELDDAVRLWRALHPNTTIPGWQPPPLQPVVWSH